jgi:CDP-4-dehydro-6-deoxyglucose reductase
MSHQITVQPSGRQFVAEADETILDAALRQGLTLPYGCKDGACGSCKGKVLAGRVDHGKRSRPRSGRGQGGRHGALLLRQGAVRSDAGMQATGSAGDIPVKTLPSRIEKLEQLAPDVMVIHLKLPASERLQFLAGQYIDILLKDGKKRSFSLANAPHDDALLQLHVRHVPGGLFTDQVFSTLKARDILRFNGPHGSFYLREDSPKPMILLAGGTGFAPIKAIVEHAIAEKCAAPDAHLLGRQGPRRSLPERPARAMGRANTPTSATSRCFPKRRPAMTGQAAPGSSIRPCWPTSRIFRAIRYMPAGRRP